VTTATYHIKLPIKMIFRKIIYTETVLGTNSSIPF
jgi:hypothetical protein